MVEMFTLGKVAMAKRKISAQGVERRKAIMAFLRSYHAEHGWAPTMQEITTAVQLVSPNATRNHLLRLQDEGYIRMQPSLARAIALLEPAPDGFVPFQRAADAPAA